MICLVMKKDTDKGSTTFLSTSDEITPFKFKSYLRKPEKFKNIKAKQKVCYCHNKV